MKQNATAAYYDLIFYYSFVNKSNVNAENYYWILSRDIENDMDINGRRVLAYYGYFVNHDAQKARLLIAKGRQVLPKFSISQAERGYEAKLLDKLSDIIDREQLLS